MRIQVHEAVLPSDDTHIKAVVFELLLPKGFVAWRDATWQLIQLGRQNTIADREPQISLRGYQGLQAYFRPTGSSITLASRTKSFLNTHYAQVPFPMTLDQVCPPHGLKYGLFDHSRDLWTSRHLEKPSFADVCVPYVPSKSVYKSLRRYFHPTFDGKPLSANEIIASQTNCPNSLTVIEYTAFQDLRLGNCIQWIGLLRELASSNLNFGTIEVGILVTELALVVGPPDGQASSVPVTGFFRIYHFAPRLLLKSSDGWRVLRQTGAKAKPSNVFSSYCSALGLLRRLPKPAKKQKLSCCMYEK